MHTHTQSRRRRWKTNETRMSAALGPEERNSDAPSNFRRAAGPATENVIVRIMSRSVHKHGRSFAYRGHAGHRRDTSGGSLEVSGDQRRQAPRSKSERKSRIAAVALFGMCCDPDGLAPQGAAGAMAHGPQCVSSGAPARPAECATWVTQRAPTATSRVTRKTHPGCARARDLGSSLGFDQGWSPAQPQRGRRRTSAKLAARPPRGGASPQVPLEAASQGSDSGAVRSHWHQLRPKFGSAASIHAGCADLRPIPSSGKPISAKC